jgi:GNAT superfamily N-acetyltransferase
MRIAEEDERARPITQQLVGEGVLEPLAETTEDNLRRWLGWELASLVELRLQQRIDGAALTEEERRLWSQRVTADGEGVSPPSACYQRGFWLLDGADRVGTLTLGSLAGRALLPLGSLYVLPAHRGRGLATRALEACHRAAMQHELHGIVLNTDWTWQRSLRFYMARKLWVRMWKHDLALVWMRDLPEYRVLVTGERAEFQLHAEDWQTLLRATRLGDRLVLEECDALLVRREPFDEVYHLAAGTFALNLALHGWPLIRSTAEWEKRYQSSDGGEPEGLAYKIQVFEAVARKEKYVVDTPRIPGLSYPTWEELNRE